MNLRSLIDLAFLMFAIIAVQIFYSGWVEPSLLTRPDSGLPLVIKDLEQQICITLMLWALFLAAREAHFLESHGYIYEVDLLKDEELSADTSASLLTTVDKLPIPIKETPLVKVMTAALRRFAITGDVHSSAASIEPALESIALQNEGRLTVLRYIAWAIPSIGFIGTVRGIGQAMAQADLAVKGDIGPMTSSLGLAFNSTFVALVISIFIMLAISLLQRKQDDQLIRIQTYVETYMIKRIVA